MDPNIAELWQRVHRALRGFIAKRIGNEAEVEDLLQEVFSRLHQHRDRLRQSDRLVSWVYQITRHAIIDYYRTPNRRREQLAGLAADWDDRIAPADAESESLARSELSSCVRPMVAQLHHEYREAIRLVEFEGLTHRQAADRLGLSVSGMKSRVQRGRRQLRALLEDCCVVELDSRRGVIDFEPRRPDTPSC